MKNLGKLISIMFLLSAVGFSQSQIAGSNNYALGGSSVMRVAKPSALFLNPGELARIHTRELFLGTNRFESLPTIGVAHFIPYVGTFAFGIGNEFSASQYSLGYARIIGTRHTVGGSLNYIKNSKPEVTFSLGSSVHFPGIEGINSGIMTGLSLMNLSSNSSLSEQQLNVGVGYWLMPNRLRMQGSWLYERKESEFPFGAEYLLNSEVAVQVGTNSFDEFACGLSYALEVMSMDFAVGKQSISFSVNVRYGDDPRQLSERYYEEGIKSYEEEQYPQAKISFLNALQYDEYYESARTYIGLSEGVTETSTRFLLTEAKQFEKEGKYLSAKKNYLKFLSSHSNDVLVMNRLRALQPKLHEEAMKIFVIADSLKQLGMFDAARIRYQQAFDCDSEDETILQTLSEMEKMIADSVAVYLAKGGSRLERNQLEAAQIAYEQVLRYNSTNPEAKKNLSIIESKLRASSDAVKSQRSTKELFDKGKSAFEQENYLEAISVFQEYLKQDPKNKDAQTFIDRARDSLVPKVEEYFKIGLQYYVEENYKKALEVWNIALTIKQDHQAILEYKNRAELKLKALEKLK
ncbi:MAG: tetratricopeptide repeat protein [Ignavibacteriae bacterium]|nr:tetratricopeptide repeat protein [Ignavibacteriota bacterium]